MKKKNTLFENKYAKSYPVKAKKIKKAVKRGLVEYAETFKRLAQT